MKIYVKHPGSGLETYNIGENDEYLLATLQNIVDGYIETVSFQGGDVNTLIICNEEGKLRGLEPNIYFRGDVLVGTVIFIGADHRGEFCDCPMTEDEIRIRIGRKVIV